MSSTTQTGDAHITTSAGLGHPDTRTHVEPRLARVANTMNRDSTMAEVAPLDRFMLSTVAAACNLDQATLSLDTEILDIGLDSVSYFSIITQTGLIYDVAFSQEEIMSLVQARTIRDLVTLTGDAIENGAQRRAVSP